MSWSCRGAWEIDGVTGAGTRIQTEPIAFYGATTNPVRW